MINLPMPIHKYSRSHVYLNVDLGQRGLPGDDTWGRPPHDRYVMRVKNYEYSFIIEPEGL